MKLIFWRKWYMEPALHTCTAHCLPTPFFTGTGRETDQTRGLFAPLWGRKRTVFLPQEQMYCSISPPHSASAWQQPPPSAPDLSFALSGIWKGTISLVCSFCMPSILSFVRAFLFFWFDVSAHIFMFSLNFVTTQRIWVTSLCPPSPEQASASTFTVLLKIQIFKLNRPP